VKGQQKREEEEGATKAKGSAETLPSMTSQHYKEKVNSGRNVGLLFAGNQMRHVDGDHLHLSCSGCSEPANFKGSEAAHFCWGVVNLLSAVEANLIGLAVERKGACDSRVGAPKENLRKEVENRVQARHQEVHGGPSSQRLVSGTSSDAV
jgi:hypothetical protein